MDLKQIAQQPFDDFNDRKLGQKAKEWMDPNVVTVDTPTGQEFHGVNAYVQYAEGFITALPDMKGTVIEHKVTGNKVVTRVQAKGTFTGKLHTPQGGVPGTGKKLDMEYTADADYNPAGKIVRFAINFDLPGFMKQLGIG